MYYESLNWAGQVCIIDMQATPPTPLACQCSLWMSPDELYRGRKVGVYNFGLGASINYVDKILKIF